MSCEINNFKKKYNIPEGAKEISLEGRDPQSVAEMKIFASLANEAATLEGFSKPLMTLEGADITQEGSETISFHNENIREFNEYIEGIQLVEEHNRANLMAQMEAPLFGEEEEGISGIIDSPGIDTSEYLYFPQVINDDSFHESPTNHYEWLETLKATQKELRRLAFRYSKLDQKEQLREVNDTLEDIQKNIEELDTNDPYSIYESSVTEVRQLDEFLNEIRENPANGAKAIESNQLFNRIDNLKMYFLGMDPDTNKEYSIDAYDDSGSPIAKFYFDFTQAIDKDRADKLRAEIRDLVVKFDNTKIKIVEGMLENDSMVQHFTKTPKEEGGWSQEDLQKVLDYVRTGDVEVDRLSSYFLGGSGAGPIGNILRNVRDNHLYSERGHILERFQRMQEVWSEIKDLKVNVVDANGRTQSVNAATLLFEKDEYGVRSRRLISKYTDSGHSAKERVKAERGAFYNNRTPENYHSWMLADKQNLERINPMLLSSIVQKYSSHPEFKRFFTHSQEEIDAYESELRRFLGDTMFEIEVSRAENLIEDFIKEKKEGLMTVTQEHRNNPFLFTENYNSENFGKRDMYAGEFLSPKFTHAVPKNLPQNINEGFSELESSEHGELLMDFYKDAYSILHEYIHPILESEGVSLDVLELLMFQDLMERETLKSMTFYGKVTHGLKAIWDSYSNMFFDEAVNRQRETLKERLSGEYKVDLNLGYIGHAKAEAKKLEDSFMRMTPRELFREAEKRGYDTSKFLKPTDINFKFFRESLARSVARDVVNETSSSNVFEILANAAQLAADISARRASVSTVEALKSYIDVMEDKGKDLTDIKGFINSWANANIYKDKYSEDTREESGWGLLGKATRTRVKRFTKLSREEKKLRKLFKAEKERGNNGRDTFNIKYDKVDENGNKSNIEITTIDNRDGTFRYIRKIDGKSPETITIKEVLDHNGEYLTQEIDKLGIDMTIGSAALGIMSARILSDLGLSPRTGIRNRFQAIIQNMSVAASGRYGFGIQEYQYARRLLSGSNTRKYFANSSFKNTDKGKALETVKMFQGRMQLRQNRADLLALEGEFDDVTTSVASKIKTFWMDFSMNNPEWKNQSEVMLSVLQTVMVKDKNGNEHPFFNGKTQEFIYEPGTLQLKEEFDTLENRAMWVEFRESDTGNRDSLVAIHKLKTAIHQTQGNYDNTDIIRIQNSIPGKMVTMYQRYLYENTDMQWGKRKVDYRTGEFEVKGRKIVLAEHAPTTAVYLAGAFGRRVLMGVGVSMFTAPIIPMAVGLAGTGFAIHQYHKHLKREGAMSKAELGLAVDFAREVLARSINTPIGFLTYGRKANAMQNSIDKLTSKERAEKRNLTKKERELLSESAQEIVSKFYTTTFYSMMMVLTKVVYTMMRATVYKDLDEDEVKEKLKEYELIMYSLINDKNNLGTEVSKFTNPGLFSNEAGSFAFFRGTQKILKFLNKDVPDYVNYETNMSTNEFIYKGLSSVPGAIFPTQVGKSILSDDKGVFKDPWVYQKGTDPLEDMILKGMRDPNDVAKKELSEERKKVKNLIYRKHRRRLKKLYPKESNAKIEERLNNIYKDIVGPSMKSHKNNRYSDYVRISEKVDWKEIKKEARNTTKTGD